MKAKIDKNMEEIDHKVFIRSCTRGKLAVSIALEYPGS